MNQAAFKKIDFSTPCLDPITLECCVCKKKVILNILEPYPEDQAPLFKCSSTCKIKDEKASGYYTHEAFLEFKKSKSNPHDTKRKENEILSS